MKHIKTLRQIKYYYNKAEYNMYYMDFESKQYEIIDGFTPDEINNAILHGIDVIVVKGTL